MADIKLYDTPQKEPQLNVWMTFPSMQTFGMSSLGYMSIVKTIDQRKDFFVEKIFTDTTNTKLRLNEVDAMGISVSFEVDFLGFFKIFENYNIPFKAKDRNETYPIIFTGGPVMTANPEPFVDFFDFIIIGDAENIDTHILDVIKQNKEKTKHEILEELSKVKGIYVPSLTKYTPQEGVTDNNGNPISIEKITSSLSKCITTPILSDKSFFSNTYVIEMVRGCPQRCGFCLASYLNLPARFCDYEEIISSIDEGLKYTNKIALLGALITAHPRFDDICKHILERKKTYQNLNCLYHHLELTLFLQ